MEWISVSDRLPEIGEEVLTINSLERIDTGMVESYCFTDENKEDFDGFEDETVTHWMPLPINPMDKKTQNVDKE